MLLGVNRKRATQIKLNSNVKTNQIKSNKWKRLILLLVMKIREKERNETKWKQSKRAVSRVAFQQICLFLFGWERTRTFTQLTSNYWTLVMMMVLMDFVSPMTFDAPEYEIDLR